MERLALALCLIAAVRGSAESCTTVVRDGFRVFTGAESVFFARAEVPSEGPYVLYADEIVRGTARLGDAVSFQRRACVFVRDGERYLVVRLKCAPPEPCIRFAEESRASTLLHYLANAHPENHEAVMAMFLRWYRQGISLAELGEWIDTVAIQPRSEVDDKFLWELLSKLIDAVSELRFFAEHVEIDAFARTELQDGARRMEEFPPGLAEDFDASAEEAGEDAPWREDLESDLLQAISGARDSAEWRKRRAEAFEIATRREGIAPR